MPMTKKEHEKELRCYPAALTAAEVAEILRVSTKTVYKLIKEKSLPAVKSAEKAALPNRSSLTICGKGKPQVRTQRSVFLRKLPKKSGLVR